MASNIVKELTTPQIYKQQIYRLQQQMQPGRKEAADVSIDFNTLSLHSNKVAKLLANQIQQKTYTASVVIERKTKVKEKFRLICRLDVFDHVVQSAICQAIMPHLNEYLTPYLYSYKSRSNYTAAREFAKFIRQNTCNNKLDLYVIRTDVKSYTDSIPIDDNSPLWPMLSRLLKWLNLEDNFRHYLLKLIKEFLRPVLLQNGNSSYQRLKGLPMGSPLGAIVALIYLNEVDARLSQHPDTFYARYGDDILIAHQDINSIEKLNSELLFRLKAISLKINVDKHQIIYLTKAGRPAIKSSFLHSQKITYLGYNITANGTIGIKVKALRAFLHDVSLRICNLARLYHNKPLEEKGLAVCQTLNQSLTENHPLAAEKLAILACNATDRKQLIALDYLIALKIATTLSGINGVKAWRKIPYKKIREGWGLNSLCIQRNNYGKN